MSHETRPKFSTNTRENPPISRCRSANRECAAAAYVLDRVPHTSERNEHHEHLVF